MVKDMPDTVRTAVGAGDRIAALRAIADALAKSMDYATPAVAAQIAGQLRATLAELAELSKAETKGTPLDELRTRRAANADAPALAGRRGRRSRSA